MTTADGKPLLYVDDFQRRAKELLDPEGWDYYSDKSGRGCSYQNSLEAFDRYLLRPRIMRDVRKRTIATTVLGHPISMPICVSPSATHRYAHPQAEIATAKGIADAGTLMVLSCYSNASIKDVAMATPNALHWMQIHLFENRKLTEHIIREAERNGYKAVVLTVDIPTEGNYTFFKTYSDAKYKRDLAYSWVNLEIDLPEVQAAKRAGRKGLYDYFSTQYETSMTWEDIKWLKSMTSLPIVCKGILTGEAAKEAMEAGVSAIVVSAHGGRHLDGLPAPIDVLPEVVSAVKGSNVEVYLDGGVRSGTDVLKAIGRGARAVFVGRPVLWGLACNGSEGVSKVLSILREEFENALALVGCTSPTDIPKSTIVHKSYY